MFKVTTQLLFRTTEQLLERALILPRLSTVTQESVEKEINSTSQILDTEYGSISHAESNEALRQLLKDPQKKQLACLLYLLRKTFLQAIHLPELRAYPLTEIEECGDLPDHLRKRLQESKESGNSVFNQEEIFIMFSGVTIKLLDLKESKFDRLSCNAIANNTAEHADLFTRAYIEVCPSLLLAVTLFGLLQTEQNRRIIHNHIVPALKFSLLTLFCATIIYKTIYEEKRIFLVPLLSFILTTFYLVYTHFNRGLGEKIDSYQGFLRDATNVFVDRNRRSTDIFGVTHALVNSKDYIDYFLKNPATEPLTLYELVHKFATQEDFLDAISFENLSIPLTEFLKEQDLDRPFPYDAFFNMILFTTPLLSHVNWNKGAATSNEASRHDNARAVLTKFIENRQAFYRLPNKKMQLENETPSLQKKNR